MNDPNNTPECPAGFSMEALEHPSCRNAAAQCRAMGIVVGDSIIGREGAGSPQTGWWNEAIITLLYMGEQKCVWRTKRRSNALPNFYDDGEQSNWTLGSRKWFKLQPLPDRP